MKRLLLSIGSLLILSAAAPLFTGCSKSDAADSAKSDESRSLAAAPGADANVSGHWEGEITLPGTKLEIRVDLAHDGAWSGSIDIPAQGLRGFILGDVSFDGERVSFKLPEIPGDPVFGGVLSSDAQSIAGNLSQSGQKFPFEMVRTEARLRKGETPSKGIPGDGFAGAWQGSIKVNIMELRLLFKLELNDGEFSGTMDSIDQGANDMKLDLVSVKGPALHIEMRSINGTYDGVMSEDGSEIVGEWKQGGQTMPLKILRLKEAPDMTRPQDPKKPYPYNEREVVFRNEGAFIQLAGTLTYPKSKGPHPAVVLITGSGAQDRDESIMGHRPFLVLADHLTRNGIAVLRFDDRGTGKSKGKYSDAVTEDFVGDALSAVAFLKTLKEIDGQRIGLVGHSEGGLVAPMAAVKSDDVAYIVLLAGVGVPMDELLKRQAEDILRVMGGTDEMASKQGETQRRIFELVRAQGDSPDIKEKVRAIMDETLEEFTPEQRQAMGVTDAQINSQISMVTSEWFRKLLEIDPRPTLEQVDVPVLAINGRKDIQVAWEENLNAIQESLKKGGNSNVKIRAFDDLNHLFQKCRTGAVAEYGTIEETFNEAALNEVSNWIRETAGLE